MKSSVTSGASDHRLGGGAAEIAADQHRPVGIRPIRFRLRRSRRAAALRLSSPYLCRNAPSSASEATRPLPPSLALCSCWPSLDPPAKPFSALIDARRLPASAFADLHAAEARVVERVRRDPDEVVRVASVGQRDTALAPELAEVMAPGFLQTLEEQVRSAEQQHLGHRRVALRQRGEVLVDHRLEQAGDDLLDRHAGLDQGVGVGLGEDAAFRADLVQRSCPRRASAARRSRRDLQLARGLLDEGAGAAAAGRLHVDLLALAGAGGA